MIMTRKMVNVDEDVYDALMELKYGWRERSLNDAIEHLLAECGIEPFDEEEYEQ